MKTWICCAALLASFGTAVVADEKPGTSPTLVAAGIDVLAKLKRLEPGASRAYYFEIMHGPEKTIGYAAVTITATGSGADLVYDHTNVGTILFPTGDKRVSDITSRLRPTFEPIEVDMWSARITPDGETRGVVHRAVIEKDKTVLTSSSGDQSVTRDAPRPRPPFIVEIVGLAAQLEPVPGERFVLREFNVRSGSARDLLFNVDVWEDGTATVITTTRDGSTSYQFWYNEDDDLMRWTEATIPAMFVQVNKPRIEELKAKFGVTRRPAATRKTKASRATGKSKP
ncbi:MAG: hypothetical protein IH989_01530 [Planctomycetes bacterium]|nr:hypothetical protein [Planctomycetota bacterium]